MKKIIIIFLIIAATKNAKAQTYGVSDTLAYLQSIVANKAQFIGQPFSVLSASLQIEIKYFSPFASIPYDKTKETSTSFSFYFPANAEEIYLTYPSLRISWQPYLNATQSSSLFDNAKGAWISSVSAFYISGIIADIKILE